MRELHLKSGKIIEFDCSVYKHVTFDDLHVCLLSGEIKRAEKRTP